MPLFTPSTKSWVSTVQEVAGVVGASADSEMLSRAHSSLRGAFQYINRRTNWDYLRTKQAPVQLIAPFTVSVTASGGSASLTAAASHGIKVDDLMSGSGVLLGSRTTATAATTFTLDTLVTGFTGTAAYDVGATRDFYDLASDYRVAYSVRMLAANRPLHPLGRRLYDRVASDQFTPGTPERYDTFSQAGKGKIQILPPPSQTDVLQIRYYRRMNLGSATADSTALDILEDYELYPVAWAKWHFLTDRQEGRGEQATTWMTLAKEGIATMIAEQTNQPDEQISFVPGQFAYDLGGPNSTRRDWVGEPW